MNFGACVYEFIAIASGNQQMVFNKSIKIQKGAKDVTVLLLQQLLSSSLVPKKTLH